MQWKYCSLLIFLTLSSLLSAQKLHFNYACGEDETQCKEGTFVGLGAQISEISDHFEFYTYQWTISDGTQITTTEPALQHQWQQDGNFTCKVRVIGGEGFNQIAQLEVKVLNSPPEIRAMTALPDAKTSNQYHFTAKVYEPGIDDLYYAWDFGDGNQSTEESPTHTYDKNEPHEVTLSVSDDDTLVTKTIAVFPTKCYYTATLTGAISGESNGILRPYGTNYLLAADSGCSWSFTGWDDQRQLQFAFRQYDTQDDSLFSKERPEPQGKVDGWLLQYASNQTYESDKSATGAINFPQAILEGFGEDAPKAPPKTDTETEIGEKIDRTLRDKIGYTPNKADIPLKKTSEKGETNYYRITKGGSRISGSQHQKRLVIRFKNTYKHAENGRTVTVDGTAYIYIPEGQEQGLLQATQCGMNSEEVFDIMQHEPDINGTHINSEDPRLTVDFTSPIDSNSVSPQNAKLGYSNRKGKFTPISATINKSDTSITFLPMEPLLPGVYYEMQIIGGDGGIKSIEGIPLPDDPYIIPFSTMVNFCPTNPSSNKSEGHKNSIIVKAALYQPVPTYYLIPNKKALLRVSADWEMHQTLAQDVQLTQLPADIEIRDGAGALLHKTFHRFKHPNLHTKEDKKNGKNTHNIILTPSVTWQSPLKVILKVRGQVHFYESLLWEHYAVTPFEVKPKLRPLKITTLFYGKGAWSFAGNNSLANDMLKMDAIRRIPSLMSKVEIFAKQLLPVSGFHVDFIAQPVLLGESFQEIVTHLSGPKLMNKYLWHTIKRKYGKQYRPDIFLAFHDQFKELTSTGSAHKRFNEPTGFITFTLLKKSLEDRMVTGITHEIGHYFDLDHVPYVANRTKRSQLLENVKNQPNYNHKEFSIDGVRINPNRRYWFKHTEYGNSEKGRLLPLLFPGAYYPTEHMILPVLYHKALINAYQRANKYTYHNSAALGYSRMISLNDTWTEKKMLVQGVITADDTKAFLLPFVTTEEIGILPDSNSPYQMVFKDESGKYIGQIGLTQLSETEHCFINLKEDASVKKEDASVQKGFTFSVNTQIPTQLKTVQIIKKDQIIFERNFAKEQIQITDFQYKRKAQIIDVSWQYKNSTPLFSSLYYRPSTESDWQLLLLNSTKNNHQFPLDLLTPGATPAFLLELNDGLNQTKQIIPFKEKIPFKINAITPENGATEIGVSPEISVYFNAPIDAQNWNQLISLTDENGTKISFNVEEDLLTKKIILKPERWLNYQTQYTLTTSTEIRNKNGQQLAMSNPWTFTTKKDIYPAIIMATFPSDGEMLRHYTAPLRIQLRYASVDMIKKAKIKVRDQSGILVETVNKTSNLAHLITLKPKNGTWPKGQNLTLTITDLIDENDNRASDFTTTFQTPDRLPYRKKE